MKDTNDAPNVSDFVFVLYAQDSRSGLSLVLNPTGQPNTTESNQVNCLVTIRKIHLNACDITGSLRICAPVAYKQKRAETLCKLTIIEPSLITQ